MPPPTVPTSKLEWLECTRCRVASNASERQGVCRCGGVLYARYRLEEAARSLTRTAIAGRGATIWRYAEVLPGSEDPVTLGEGMTPLLPARFLAPSVGDVDLWIKDEAPNPTGSFKARGLAAAVTRAVSAGARRFTLPTAGNAGVAAAAYGARAGAEVRVFAPRTTPAPLLGQMAAYGATVVTVDGGA